VGGGGGGGHVAACAAKFLRTGQVGLPQSKCGVGRTAASGRRTRLQILNR
jgi:hypothetical protein